MAAKMVSQVSLLVFFISRVYLVSVAEQTCLSLNCYTTQNTGFLLSEFISYRSIYTAAQVYTKQLSDQ